MTRAHKLFLKWLLQFNLIFFFIFFAFDQGLIYKILSSDKSYITSLILLIFILVSVHCAFNTFKVSDELNKAHIIKKSLLKEQPIKEGTHFGDTGSTPELQAEKRTVKQPKVNTGKIGTLRRRRRLGKSLGELKILFFLDPMMKKLNLAMMMVMKNTLIKKLLKV